VLGVRALSNPDGFAKQFSDAAGTKTSKALALRCGLLNLQVAALQVAACNADMKARARCRTGVHNILRPAYLPARAQLPR
jgi:hypothetical protein